MMKKIKKLDVEADSILELVEVNGRQLVLKTAQVDEVILERKFLEVLGAHKLPHIQLIAYPLLADNQLLLEYIQDSPTLDKEPLSNSYRKWGAIVRKMHSIHSDCSVKVQPDGSEVEVGWRDFIQSQFLKNAQRHRENKTLGEIDIRKIERIADELQKIDDSHYSLIHGDLHDNNAMLKGDDVVLFDKGSYMLYGDRFYDLATAVITCYDHGKFPLLPAFIEGYEENFMIDHKRRIELNIIFRAFERFPNRFETQSGEVFSLFLEKLSGR